MRDISYGWFIRYLHANTARFFFIFMYLHVARGLYYSRYKSPRTLVWSIGVIMLVITIAIAFLGYTDSLKCYNISNLYIHYIYSLCSYLSITLSSQCYKILKWHNLQVKAVFENLHIEGKKDILKTNIKSVGIYYY